jgi:NlpC/P60 family protein
VIPRIACAIPVCLLLSNAQLLADDVVDFAARFIGRPYVWGAEGPNSFDCSGLTQYVFQEFGIELPRRAVDQSRAGDPSGRRLQRGDLLFFSNDARQSLVTHVGIYEGSNIMIDASKRHGRVRRDDLREDFWIERFMFARRVNASADDEIRVAGDDRTDDPPRRSSDRRRATVRIIEVIAGELLKIPARSLPR